MPVLHGKKITRKELLEKVGDISQVGGIKLAEFQDGNEKGVNVAEFRTGSGLNFNVCFSRGMAITYAEYKGISLCWRSATGDVNPSFYEPEGLGWLRNFYGGMMNTCGITYAGAPCEDEGKMLGLHGRADNTPAKNVSMGQEWQNDDYLFWVQGKVREAVVFDDNICLTRKVSARLGEKRFFVDDKVENLGYKKIEHAMLYHINCGFPVLDEGSILVAPTKSVKPRNADAEVGKEDYYKFTAPIPGFKERVYYHMLQADKNGYVKVAVVNKKFNNGQGLAVYAKYKLAELPLFNEWKMMGQGTYVVGMEPANCRVDGRNQDRKNGILQFLEPGETREYHLEIGVLDSPEEIAELEKAASES